VAKFKVGDILKYSKTDENIKNIRYEVRKVTKDDYFLYNVTQDDNRDAGMHPIALIERLLILGSSILYDEEML
jgi:hypothetical protein